MPHGGIEHLTDGLSEKQKDIFLFSKEPTINSLKQSFHKHPPDNSTCLLAAKVASSAPGLSRCLLFNCESGVQGRSAVIAQDAPSNTEAPNAKACGGAKFQRCQKQAWLFLASYEAAADLELTRFFSVIPVALATLSKAEGERARDKIFVSRRKLSDLERESL